MALPINFKFIFQIIAQYTIGAGQFSGDVSGSMTPAGADPNQKVPLGTTAGKVSGVFLNNPLTVPSSGSPLVLTLSALNDPNNTNTALQHVTHYAFENTDPAATVTIMPNDTHGVTFLPATGITLPPSSVPGQNSFVARAVPAGEAIVSGSSDKIKITIDTGTNVVVNGCVAGRNT